MTNRLPRAWVRFFTENDIPFSEQLNIPEKPSNQHQLIVIPQGIDVDKANELFKKKVDGAGFVTFTGPGSFNGVPYSLSDLVSHDDRSAKDAPYARWVQGHIAIRDGKLVRTGDADQSMTLLEGFLYHLFMMDHFGTEQYLLAHHMYVHPCRGTHGGKRGATEQTPWFDFDLQDIKICLRWW